MPVIRTCSHCGQKNRVPGKFLASTGRCGSCKSELAPTTEPVAADAALFDEIVQNANVPVLVDFWAEWCGPCKMIAPLLDEIAKELPTKVKIVKVNVDEEQQLAQQYGIYNIPTLLFFKGGQVADQVVGAVPKEQIVKVIEKHANA